MPNLHAAPYKPVFPNPYPNPMNPNRPSENRKNRPRDAAFALALSALFALLFAAVYGGANLLAGAVSWRVRPALAFEAAIPFLPAAATVYLSLPLLLVCCALRADRRGAWTLFAVLCAELLAAAPFFVLLPVETAWPPRVAAGVWRPFFLLADALSLPRNHFPSPHTAFACTAAWFAWRQKFPRRAWLGAWAAAVVASTLLIREHHLADLAGGLLLALAACRWVPPPCSAAPKPNTCSGANRPPSPAATAATPLSASSSPSTACAVPGAAA